MNTSGKGADGARKQSGSPVDGGQRKPSVPKAWTQGTNPLTQRSTNYNNSNGVNTPKPSQNAHLAFVGESPSPMKHLSDRMMFLLANLTGLPGSITLKNGERYTGVLSGTSLDPSEMRYVFKMVKRVQPAGESHANGTSELADDYVGAGDNHVMSFDMSDVSDFNVSNVVLDKSQTRGLNASSGFRTDTDISGHMAIRERNLQRWEPTADANVDMSLESSGRTGEWDQFAANEQKFGVQSSYDESYYTTTIDRSNPEYAARAARAERIAREIENSSATNAHVQEERGRISTEDAGLDEEEKYSGVRRDFPPLPSGQPNKYTPPARRPPTGQPTVHGAPVDPAIISAQLARPGSQNATPAPAPTAAPAVPAEKRAAPEPPKQELPAKPEIATPSKPEQAPAKTETKAPFPVKPPSEQTPKPSSTLKQSGNAVPARIPGRTDNATANVENEVLDSFRQFSANEKLRMSERQRSIQRESKAVKLNDLKKFAQNFKLNTPVPNDLVPILAKDETKQQQIVEKALRAVEEQKATPPKAAPATLDQKPVRPANTKPEPAHPTPPASVDRPQNQRPRPGPNTYNSASMGRGSGPNGNQGQRQGLLSARLALNQQQHKQQGAPQYNGVPHPIPAQEMRNPPPTGPSASSSGVQTPTSSNSMRFNVRAADFKPNPAANTFQPTSNQSTNSSPRPDVTPRQEPIRKPQVVNFFGAQRPSMVPLKLNDTFNPIKRMMKEADGSSNGGIPPPFRTPPTWDYPTTNNEKGYTDMFDRPSAPTPIPAPHNGMGNGPIPHQHQLPPHLQGPQNVPQGPTPHHTPRHPPVQPNHGQNGPPQFEGQHMQFSHSNSSVHPSPRAGPPYMYNVQQQNIPNFPQQMPMQPYGMSPGLQHAHLRQPGGPQFGNGPGPAMGGQMMTNQPSNGPYMNMPTNPQMPMYSPAPGAAYPHYPGQMPGPPGSNTFPSPQPARAPLMSHQGSSQGHQQPHLVYMHNPGQAPQMYGQIPPGSMTPLRGPYAQPHQTQYGSPHQHHQFPQQHRGTPSGSYVQPMMQQHSMQPQGPPPTGPAAHGPEGGEEVK
ncbi:hypothetical protein P154DRAFT_425781 [Amniculicola lignicola CBS 123094]|uniref:LsmAD domain-containing protein n=1 Tax=Amniculicola lignicola CBS 123094 TaxID=1392246 RepID=A0A6A5WV52_9PLEO|nr:hypothetical protein P154DRAFT_425781 [Amniculicola lignicola CBS 123094]